MPDHSSVAFPEVLSSEYYVLRPESDFTSQDKTELFEKVHRQPQPFRALCISGGGIRKALSECIWEARFLLNILQATYHETHPNSL
jgi:hypothetical protein